MKLNEMDMLMSMFVSDEEIVFDDPSVLADIRDLVASGESGVAEHGELLATSGQIGFTLKLQTENKVLKLLSTFVSDKA